MMLEHAIYSVLSPEGFASILWKDEKRAAEAAKVMELRAQDLKRKGVIDTIIKEPLGGAHHDLDYVIAQLDEELLKQLERLMKKKEKTLLSERYEKFRRMGQSYEGM